MSDYRESVVNLGDDASKMLYEVCKTTWPNRSGRYGEVEAGVDKFRGDRSWSVAPLLEVPEVEKIRFTQEADGIGTKVKVSQGCSSYTGAASDMTAMVIDDATAKGYEGVVMTTVLNVNRLTEANKPYMFQLGRGAIESCRRGNIAMFGGETAILGDLVGGYGNPDQELWFDWSGTVHAAAHQDRIINGQEIRPGMTLVGFQEFGFRSNGITKVRELLDKTFGEKWYGFDYHDDDISATLGEAVLRSSIIYTPVLLACTGGYDLRVEAQAHIAGAAHITGGGIWSKLGDLLAVSGYGADIELPYEPPYPMQLVQRMADMSDKDAYGTWNMGQGMIVVTDEPEKVIDLAAKSDVLAKELGPVTKKPGIRIRSAGAKTPGQILTPEAA